MKKLYVIVLIFLSCYPSEIFSASKTKKKSYKTTTESTTTTTSQPAIIAIEIVDPNENSTSGKHSKRTIEGSLGYGYNSFDTSKPRYEVYKYSQHDIPPYTGDTNNLFQGSSHNQVNVQKSIQYTLPTVSQQVSSSSNILQPGTTLYSSLSEKGQIGSLSTNLPKVPSFEHGNVPVPVVVLRIYPNQLKESTIQAKLPKSHPFAKNINSLNIQTLLLQYIKTLKNPGNLSQYSATQESFGGNYGPSNQYSLNKGSFRKGHGSSNQYSAIRGSFGNNHGFGGHYPANDGQYHGSSNKYSGNQQTLEKNQGYSSQYLKNQGSSGHNTYNSNQAISLPIGDTVKPAQVSYQTSNYNNNQEIYQNIPYQSNTGRAQNYMFYEQSFPQQSTQEYTSQSQYRQQQSPEHNSDVTVVEAPIKYEISPYQTGNQWRYQASTIQKPQISKSSSPTPQPEYYYVQPNTQNSYSTESSQYYQPTQQLEYSKQSVLPDAVPEQQYYTGNEESQYSGYYQDAGQQYEAKNQKLLTFENYPTTKHTRVVFKTKSGAIRTSEPEQTPTKEIKTIKIHVPENIANVEVQETEQPYYTPEPAAYSGNKQNPKEESANTYETSGDSEQVISQNNYYLPADVVPQDYYNNKESASKVFYNYQNVNYEDMAKYFEKRGAMPKYFYQNSEETENVNESSTEITKQTKDIISTYEEAAFPSTTASAVKKKVKSKKRIPM